VHRSGRTGRAGLPGEAISLVAPEDMDAITAVERLIKKRIERMLVPGFQPSGATVAALMGDEPTRKRTEPVRRERRPAPGHPPKRPTDPIFSTPYEPTVQASEAPKPAEASQKGKRKQPQVAALLGGIKKP
jgi:ATP-dependent RNA helicase RhlE